jgi:hypothetical protein
MLFIIGCSQAKASQKENIVNNHYFLYDPTGLMPATNAIAEKIMRI